MKSRLCLFVATLFAFYVPSLGLPTGAPTFSTVCTDMTQQHAGILPMSCDPGSCPFTLTLLQVDGEDVPAGREAFYRCGSLHTIRVQSSGPTFRGFAVQSRASSADFGTSSDSGFIGEFVNPGGDWQIWSCPGGDSATHTSRSDKSFVDITWRAPGAPSTADVIFWFSITRVFIEFHAQLRGLELSPDPAFCVPPTTQPPPDFELTCDSSAVSPSGPVSLSCNAANGVVSTVSCNYDNGAIVEDCSLNFAIDFTRFSPGDHSLVITATSTTGATSSFSTGFTVPEPLILTCVQGAVSGRVEVTCSASKDLFLPLSCQVTADGGSPTNVPCNIDEVIVFSIPDFVPGVSYSLTVSGTDVDEQTDTEVVDFQIAALPNFELTCGSSSVSPSGPVSVTCNTMNGDAESVSCNYDDGAIVEDCSLNFAIDFTRFSAGGHNLVITATTSSGVTSSSTIGFVVPEPLVLTCVLGAVSGRVEVTCSASKDLFLPLSCQVTADGGSPTNVPCNIDEAIVFSIPDFVPGVSYSLTVSGTDVDEQTDTEVVEFEITPLPDFELTCGSSSVSPSGPVSVTCNTVNGAAESVSCNYDDGAIVEDCSLNFAIDFTRFSAGGHSLVITATTSSGATSSTTIGFTVPEPLELTCVQGAVSGRVEVTCSASKDLFLPLSCQVTADGGSPTNVPCNIDETIVFSIPDFVPGVSYSLTVSGTDVDEQTDTEVVEFEISAPLELTMNFINDSPRVDGSTISGDIQVSRPVTLIRCALSGLPYQDCTSGSVTFTNVPPREPNNRAYFMRVVGYTEGRVRAVIRRAFFVEVPNQCTVHFINDGITVNGNTATAEFTSTGPAQAFFCSIDRGTLLPCASPQVFPDLSSGAHRLKVVPDIGVCGRNRRVATIRFIV